MSEVNPDAQNLGPNEVGQQAIDRITPNASSFDKAAPGAPRRRAHVAQHTLPQGHAARRPAAHSQDRVRTRKSLVLPAWRWGLRTCCCGRAGAYAVHCGLGSGRGACFFEHISNLGAESDTHVWVWDR